MAKKRAETGQQAFQHHATIDLSQDNAAKKALFVTEVNGVGESPSAAKYLEGMLQGEIKLDLDSDGTLHVRAKKRDILKKTVQILTISELKKMDKTRLDQILEAIQTGASHRKAFTKASGRRKKTNSLGTNIDPKSEAQEKYLAALEFTGDQRKERNLILCMGPAGTGKTLLAIGAAIHALETGHINKIVLSRPLVGHGKDLGYLPGSKEDKMDPFLRPFYDAMHYLEEQRNSGITQADADKQVTQLMGRGQLEVVPLHYITGRNFRNAMVIVDEAGMTTAEEAQAIITRLGEKSKLVLCGDPEQAPRDFKIENTNPHVEGEWSGIQWAARRLGHLPQVHVQKFTEADCERSPFVKAVLTELAKPDPAVKAAPSSAARGGSPALRPVHST